MATNAKVLFLSHVSFSIEAIYVAISLFQRSKITAVISLIFVYLFPAKGVKTISCQGKHLHWWTWSSSSTFSCRQAPNMLCLMPLLIQKLIDQAAKKLIDGLVSEKASESRAVYIRRMIELLILRKARLRFLRHIYLLITSFTSQALHTKIAQATTALQYPWLFFQPSGSLWSCSPPLQMRFKLWVSIPSLEANMFPNDSEQRNRCCIA